MRIAKKLIFAVAGFLCLCLCGAAFAAPSFDRFIVDLDTKLPGGPNYTPLVILESYTRQEGTEDLPDTWKLRYVPSADARMAFRVGAEGSGFAGGDVYDFYFAVPNLYSTSSGPEIGILNQQADRSGKAVCTSANILLLDFLQTKPAASDGVFTLKTVGHLSPSESANAKWKTMERYMNVTFAPERPSLSLKSGTAGIALASSHEADYECTLPAGTAGLHLEAGLSGTVARELRWQNVNTPSTVRFEHDVDVVSFGKPATFSNTLTFSSSPAGTSVSIAVALPDAPDGTGRTETLTKTLKIFFGASDSSFSLSRASFAGVVGTALTGEIGLIPAGSRDTLSEVQVSPSSWNGISLTPADNRILLSGIPSGTGEKTFVVTASVNGKPRAATFTVSIAASTATMKLSESKVEGHVDVPMLHTLTVAGSSPTDIVGALSVTPSSWNGISASVSGNTVTLKGTPVLSGSGKFLFSAPVNGVVRSADLMVSVSINALSSLKLSPSTIGAAVGKNLSTTIVTYSAASSDIIAQVTVSPANWNGLTALVSDTKILLSGAPEGAGSQVFAVTAVVNAKASSATFRVDVGAEGTGEETPEGGNTLPVSAMPEDWHAGYDAESRAFSLSTAMSLPAASQKTLRAKSVASAAAVFKYADAVESVQANASAGEFSVTGKVRAGAKLNNVILDKISVTYSDGATYERDNLALMLTQVLEDEYENTPSVPSGGGTSSGGEGGSGCNAGTGISALLLCGLPLFLSRSGRKRL